MNLNDCITYIDNSNLRDLDISPLTDWQTFRTSVAYNMVAMDAAKGSPAIQQAVTATIYDLGGEAEDFDIRSL